MIRLNRTDSREWQSSRSLLLALLTMAITATAAYDLLIFAQSLQ